MDGSDQRRGSCGDANGACCWHACPTSAVYWRASKLSVYSPFLNSNDETVRFPLDNSFGHFDVDWDDESEEPFLRELRECVTTMRT